MPNAGIMASAVVTATNCTDVLSEPFNNTSAWTTAGSPTIVTGRTGTCMRVTSITQSARYIVTTPQRSDTFTVGFAWRGGALGSSPEVVGLPTGAATAHVTMYAEGTGRLSVARTGVATLGNTATGLIAANTWAYIEMKVKLHDTAGTVVVNVNGVERMNVSGVDTALFAATTFDAIQLRSNLDGSTYDWDDLYLSTGTGCTFKGDQTIP